MSDKNKKSYYAIIPANVRYDKELTANAKLLYGEITALCNEKGYCWASNDYFASLYGVSKVSVQKWLKALEDNGYIKRTVKRKDGSKEIDTRYITLVSGGHQEKLATPHQDKLADNNTVINTTSNIYNSQISEKTPHQKIVELYNNICTSLPKVLKLTDKRKRTLTTRWKTYNDLDTYKGLFTKAEESDFLSGRNGKWTNCNFDWLINENNMIKVLEGNYKNGGNKKHEPREDTERPREKSLNELIAEELERQGRTEL